MFRVLTEIVSYCMISISCIITIAIIEATIRWGTFTHGFSFHTRWDFDISSFCEKLYETSIVYISKNDVSQVLFPMKIIIQNDKTLIVLLITHGGFKK